jgi:sortase A
MSVDRDIALGVECALPPMHGTAQAPKPRWIAWIVALLAFVCALQFGGDVFGIDARRTTQESRLDHAWQRTLAGEAGAAPRARTNSRPVARLAIPSQGLSTLVVSGEPSADEVSAPLHQPGTPLPGEPGNSVIGDRNGSALHFLRQAKRGDLLSVQRADRESLVYRVTDIEIIDQRDVWIMKNEGPTRLTMITCYPFDAQCAHHRLRYAVIARALPSGNAAQER